jgi:hypothetical protein
MILQPGTPTLLEKDDVFAPEPKVPVGLEKLFSFQPRRSAGHDVPRQDDRARGSARLLLRDLL